jgi:hypothetical protein
MFTVFISDKGNSASADMVFPSLFDFAVAMG